jgi:hypothetical protein
MSHRCHTDVTTGDVSFGVDSLWRVVGVGQQSVGVVGPRDRLP